MRDYSRRLPRMLSLLWLSILAAVFVSIEPQNLTQATPTPVGPGIAGRIYAIAWDPGDSSRVFVGGDTCELYRSTDAGMTWHPWSDGMQLDVMGRTIYVDDIVVLNGQPGVHNDLYGVYAATCMGIFYRKLDGLTPWKLLTKIEAFSYVSSVGHEAGMGRAIPFSALEYDEGNSSRLLKNSAFA